MSSNGCCLPEPIVPSRAAASACSTGRILDRQSWPRRALPLGLVYGWLVIPQLEAVIPFWAVPLAFGFLSLPRQAELEGGGGSAQEPGSDSS